MGIQENESYTEAHTHTHTQCTAIGQLAMYLEQPHRHVQVFPASTGQKKHEVFIIGWVWNR